MTVMRIIPRYAFLCSAQLVLYINQNGAAGAAELAKALATNGALTYVCMPWYNALWEERALQGHSSFALTRGRFDASTQLTLSHRYISAAARNSAIMHVRAT